MELTVARRVRSFLSTIPERGHGLRLFLALVGAYLIALSARVVIPLPFTPVPITLQVFSVLVACSLLGPFYGGLCPLLYVLAGIAGLPWYAGGGTQLGVTAGYLAGFIAAGGLVGYLTHHHEFRGEAWRIGVALAVGLVVIYILGAFHFAMMMNTTYRQTLELAVIPFVIPDIGKVVAASLIVHWVFGTRWALVQKNRRGS